MTTLSPNTWRLTNLVAERRQKGADLQSASVTPMPRRLPEGFWLKLGLKGSAAKRSQKERSHDKYEHTPTGIAIMDLKARFQFCNTAFVSMLGYSCDELQSLSLLDILDAGHRPASILNICRLISQETPFFESVNQCIAADGRLLCVQNHVSLLRDVDGEPSGIVALMTDITKPKQYEERICLLIEEVNHRAKNMLAVVLAMARQTMAANPKDFIDRFSERIYSLAASHSLIAENQWRGVELGDLVRCQLAPFSDLIGMRIKLKGEPILISVPAAQALGIALHELAANAGKYGSLSQGDGGLQVQWRFECRTGGERDLVLCWREHGGPPVTPPVRRGFGSAVLSGLVTQGLDGRAELDFAGVGVSWRLSCPANQVMSAA